MTTFLLDLWQDLRAKRLWPIAVGLLLATAAVPLVLFKPASSTPPPTGATPAADANKLPSVNLDASSVENSHLNVFHEKNPFKSLAETTGASAQAAGSGLPSTSSSSSSSSSTAGSSGSSGTSSSDTSGGSTGGSTAGGSGVTAPSGGGGHTTVHHGTRYFTYTVDVRFGTRSKMKSYKSVKELQLIPGGKNPVLSFMGVKHGDTAVFFLTDSAFRVDGEGTCKPSNKDCMFLYLKKDADHNEATLSAQDGQIEYDLKLTGLHVKRISKKSALGKTTPDKSKGSKSKRAERKQMSLLDLPTLGLAPTQ